MLLVYACVDMCVCMRESVSLCFSSGEVWVANATYINHDVCPPVTIVIPATRLKQNPSGSALLPLILVSVHKQRVNERIEWACVRVCTCTYLFVSKTLTLLCLYQIVYIFDIDRCDQMFSIVLAGFQPEHSNCVSVQKACERAVIFATVNIQTIQFTRDLGFVIVLVCFFLLFSLWRIHRIMSTVQYTYRVSVYMFQRTCQFSVRCFYLHTQHSLQPSWFSFLLILFRMSVYERLVFRFSSSTFVGRI